MFNGTKSNAKQVGQSHNEAPDLVTKMPRTPAAPGVRAAETVIPLGQKAILDIVTPAEEEVLGWCCFARERHSGEWHRVQEVSGKYAIQLPDTVVAVWGFHRFDDVDVENADENVWRIYAENQVRSGRSADICLRLVVRSAAREIIRELPRRASPMRARVGVPSPRTNPLWEPVPALAASGRA